MALSQNVNLLDDIMQTKKMPTSASSEADYLQALRTVQEQPQVSSQQLGAAMLSSAGQAQIKKTQEAIQEMTPKAEMGLERQQMAVQQEASAREIAIRKLADKNANRIAELDIAKGKQISELNRQFKLDSAGRKYLNQQMLDNYMVSSAQSEQELQDYISYTNMMYQRKAQILDTYAKQLEAVAMRGYYKEKQDLDQASLETITIAAANFRKKQQEELDKQRKRGSLGNLIMQVGVTAIGVAITAYSGGTMAAPAAAMMGAAGVGAAGAGMAYGSGQIK